MAIFGGYYRDRGMKPDVTEMVTWHVLEVLSYLRDRDRRSAGFQQKYAQIVAARNKGRR